MAKTLLELLEKYKPNAAHRLYLEGATDIQKRVDTERRILEISAAFPTLIPKAELYAMESEIEEAYRISRMRILPRYPASLFDEQYIPELIAETERVGVVARGFFSFYDAHLEDDTVVVELPYTEQNMRLMQEGKTAEVMEGIIRSEFGITRKVKLVHSAALEKDYSFDVIERELSEWDEKLRQSSAAYEAAKISEQEKNEKKAEKSSETDFPRVTTLFPNVRDAEIRGNTLSVGFYRFHIANPQPLLGESFDIKATPLAQTDRQTRGLVVVGEIFGYVSELNRNGDKYNVSFCITDGQSSLAVKKPALSPDDAAALGAVLKDGVSVAMRGYTKHDAKKDGEDVDVTFTRRIFCLSSVYSVRITRPKSAWNCIFIQRCPVWTR